MDPELLGWFRDRIEHDRSLRSMSHVVELALELLREDLEERDAARAAPKKRRSKGA